MRVLNQITFEAKDDAEAMKLASERLGKDAVIVSTRRVRVGGFLGFFQRHVLQVSAGILQDDSKPEKTKEKEKDDVVSKERLVAFQKLLEFKQAAETRSIGEEPQEPQRTPRQPANDAVAKVIYSPTRAGGPGGGKNAQEFDSVQISQAGLSGAGREAVQPVQAVQPAADGGADAMKLRVEVEDLTKRLDTILQRLGSPLPAVSKPDKFEPGLDGIVAGALNKQLPPAMEEVYQSLIASEMEPRYALQLVQEYQERKVRDPFIKWLESKIKCAADTSSNVLGGRKVMLMGPTGAGKTTTIAKLAAIQALWEHKNLLLLTSDTYRIAAVDQLRTYAKILGVPIEVIFEVENFANILKEHANADLILLDTAGRGQKDRKSLETFQVLYNVFEPDAIHLVLAANMKYRDMQDVVERMSGIPVSHVIFTKLDETVSYGVLFNMVKSLDKPISFFTTGQNVPNDIEVASGTRLANLLMGDEVRSSAP